MSLEAVKEEKATATQMPQPAGWWLLIAIPEADKKYNSGLIKADTAVRDEEIYSIVGFVMDMGPDAYVDKAKFPSGAYCKKGDFILMGALKGQRFWVHGKEFRLLSDDSVMGVVQDPRGYSAYSSKA